MKQIQNIILDFDGTLTDTEKESIPAINKWHELFCEKTSININYHKEQIEKNINEIILDKKSGWIKNGKIIAPGAADPFVLVTTAYQKIIQKYINEEKYPLAKNQADIDTLLYELFTKSYTFSDTVFREGAKEFLNELYSKYDIVIVTNSKTDSVRAKLNQLNDYIIPIIGNAKKYDIDNIMLNIQESINLENFPRPIFLRRLNYYNILSEFNPKTTTVIGDIYELDLALPEYLKFNTIQIETSTTPKYEIERKSNTNYYLAKNYAQILARLEKNEK
jgi:FMN phosphatase YigB (HAD superfamily)